MLPPTPQVFPDAERLAAAAAQYWIARCAAAIRARGAFHAALSGGGTPRRLYQLLAGAPARTIEWDKVHIWFGDERCVATDHADSNYRMADEALLRHVPIAPQQVHPMVTEPEAPERDAARYAERLAALAPRDADGVPQLDLVLLGLGSDGHTASLFPHTPVLEETQRTVAAVYVEKLGAWRVTLTLPSLNHTRRLLFLVEGKGKATIIGRVFHQPQAGLPVQRIAARGEVLWYLDAAAASGLEAERAQ